MNYNNNVFLFWIGDIKLISNTVNTLKEKKFNVVIGPTKEEHDYLYKNYTHYQKSYDNKIWALCSDVWRFYVLSKYKGLYIDTTVKIGCDFEEFYEIASQKNYYFVKERKSVIASAVMGSFGDGKLFKKALEIVKNFNSFDPQYYFVSPFVITKVVKEKCNYPDNWNIFANDEIFIDILTSIRNSKYIIKYGSGSWMIGREKNIENFEKNDMWLSVEKDWNRKHFYTGSKQRYYNSLEDIYSPDIIQIRKNYEAGLLTKKDAKELIGQIKYSLNFGELFLWSVLYKMFKR